MLRATLKSFLAHKWRLLLTMISVVLGVSFVAGTYVLTDTMGATFDTLFAEAEAGIDVEVRAKAAFLGEMQQDRPRVPESLLDTVLEVDGVAVAEGGVTGFAQIVAPDGEAIAPFAPTLGVSWPRNERFAALTVRDGVPPSGPGEVAIDAATAAEHGFVTGDQVTILFEGSSEEFELVGIAGFGSADNLGGATLAAFEIETAQRLFEAEGEYDAILVGAEEDVSPVELRNRIASRLPTDVEALTGTAVAEEQADQIQEGLGFFNTFLLVFAGIALFVGAFSIFNTFNILVTQRTRELALLRALGASRGQTTRSVLLEALLIGAIASAVGLGFGILIAILLRWVFDAIGIDIPSGGLVILGRTVIAAFVVGIVVTVAASVMPARRAARIPPIAALRDVEAVRPVSVARRGTGGGLVTAAGLGLLLYGLFWGGGIEMVGLGVLVTFIGVAVLTPVLARPLAGLIGAPIRRISRFSGKLGRENAMRNPRRTAATASALTIGLALVGTFLILGESFKASVSATIERNLRADYILTPTNQFGSFSPVVAERLREQPEIGVVSQTRFGEWRREASESSVFVTAIDRATVDDVLTIEMVEEEVSALTGDAVLVQDGEATARGLEVGDTLPMEFASTGIVRARVAGTFEENPLLGDYLISLEMYEANFTRQLDSMVLVNATEGGSEFTARGAIDRVVREFPSVQVQDQAGLRAEVERQIGQILGLVTGLLLFAVLIALIGIANTLALSVFERTRELGLLRAVGMGRRQVRAMIRWESVIIAVLGGVIGVVVGLAFGWALVRGLADEGISEFAVPVGQLIVCLVAAGLAGVVAAIWPARRAARLDVLRAIAHE